MAENLPSALKDLSDTLAVQLALAGSKASAQDARYMIHRRTGLGWAEIVTEPGRILDPAALEEIGRDLDLVKKGVPLSRIYGVQAFWGREFEISEHTLDPRIDTEIIVQLALARLKGRDAPLILDLGTGSGCILLSLLCERADARGVGVDLAGGALATARRNAARHGAGERALFTCSDWAAAVWGLFDLVVSNPPYISNRVIPHLDENVRKFDPILALDGGEDGLDAYRKIFLQLPVLLKPGASALFEIGFDQADAVLRLSGESGFSKGKIHPDSGGLPRVLEISHSHPCGDK